MNLVTMKKFSEETGYSLPAIRSKIYRGDWIEDVHFIKAPDQRVLMDLQEYTKWAMGLPQDQKRPSR